MRKIFKEIHLWLSIPFGVLITVMCLTGATLIYEDEILEIVNPHLYKVEYNQGDVKLSPSQIMAKVKTQIPDSIKIRSVELYGDPTKAAQLRYEGGSRFQSISVNPYTAQVNGFVEWSGFFKTMFYTHRWMMNPPKVKGEFSFGKFLTASSTIVLIVVTLTGFVIWFPRRGSKNYGRIVKNRLQFSVTKGWRRFWYDSHLSLGFYTAILALLICVTGLTWSFPVVRKGVVAMLGADKNEKSVVTPLGITAQNSENALDNAYMEILKLYPEYQSINVSRAKISIKPDPKSANSFMNDSYKLDEKGNLVEVQYWHDLAMQNKTKSIIYNLHTGFWGGSLVKFLYFLTVLIIGILPISGYYLWIKRKFSKRKTVN